MVSRLAAIVYIRDFSLAASILRNHPSILFSRKNKPRQTKKEKSPSSVQRRKVVVGSSSRSTVTISSPYSNLPQTIQPILKKWSNCQDCNLCKTRTNLVYFRGEAPAEVLFIG